MFGDGQELDWNLKYWSISTTTKQDVILDLGSDVSLIDQKLIDDLSLTVNPFVCDVAQAASLRGRGELHVAVSNVIGWVELELGIYSIGCLYIRLFVAKHLINKGVQVVLGSQIIRKIFAQANVKRIDCWQESWRLIYEGCIKMKWCTEDLSDSDSDHDFEVVSRHITSWRDKTLEKVRSSTPTWEEEVQRVEKRIATDNSTALKGIPGPLKEPDGQEDSTPTAPKLGLPLPIGVEESSSLDGGKTSVFANLTKELEGLAVHTEAPPCNPQESAQAASTAVRSFPLPLVSCKVTPTGEATFSLQWESK